MSCRCSLVAPLVVVACLASPVFSDVVFEFNFLDEDGVGFNADGKTGADRRAAMNLAGDYLSEVLGSAYTATIKIDVDGSVTDGTFLASASSAFWAPVEGDGFHAAGDVQIKILGGNKADPARARPDGVVFWNFHSFDWEPYEDFQDTGWPRGEYDIQSTAIHELSHTLGFSSDILADGGNPYGPAPGQPAPWQPFDEFIADAQGSSIIDSNFALDKPRWDAASVGGAGPGGLQFNGPHAVAANDGNPVYLYSPSTWEGGSSGAHLDTDYYTGRNGTTENMMNHASTKFAEVDIRTFTPIELGILCDIGYTEAPACASFDIAAVPEPSAFLFLGLTCTGVLGFRRLYFGPGGRLS